MKKYVKNKIDGKTPVVIRKRRRVDTNAVSSQAPSTSSKLMVYKDGSPTRKLLALEEAVIGNKPRNSKILKKNSSESRLAKSTSSILNECARSFPAVFNRDNVRPLKLGAYYELKQLFKDDFRARDVYMALRRHTNTRQYLQSLKEGDPRYDLSGVVAGFISKQEEEEAMVRLSHK